MPPPEHHHIKKKLDWRAKVAIIGASAGLCAALTPVAIRVLDMVDRWHTIDKMAKYGYTPDTNATLTNR